MKNILVMLAAALAFLSTLSGQTIAGTIPYFKRSYVVFSYQDQYFLVAKKDTIALSNDGSFHWERKLQAPIITGQLEVALKQSVPIWFAANEKLAINIKDSSGLPNFSGPLARINQYLQADGQYNKQIFQAYELRNPDFKRMSSLRTDEYFGITDSMTADRISFLERFFTGSINRSEKLFIAQREKELIYQNLFYKISYDNPPLEKLKFYQTHFKKSGPISYKFSEQISFNSPDLLSNPYFLRFSRMFFMELVFKFQKEQKARLSKEQFYDKFFYFINQLSSNKLCNAILKASFINDEVNTMTLNQTVTESTYSRFVDSLLTYPQIRNEAKLVEDNFYTRLNELYAFKKGKAAPPCTLTDSSGHVVSLESFKGKLLYIDVWASWCSKCIDAMPYWNKLIDKYKDNKDVVFITVSTDEAGDKNKWLRLLEKLKPQGQHFISVGGSSSEFAKAFLVNSYPTNILIDKEGRIIDIKADRPETIDLSAYLQ